MNDTAFVCKKDTFSSYLAEQMTSFVEYKVNVNGCVPESFIPPLKLLDDYCLKHPKDSVCLTKGLTDDHACAARSLDELNVLVGTDSA